MGTQEICETCAEAGKGAEKCYLRQTYIPNLADAYKALAWCKKQIAGNTDDEAFDALWQAREALNMRIWDQVDNIKKRGGLLLIGGVL